MFDTREFFDIDKQRKLIFDNVQSALTSKFPVANDRYTLELGDVGYDAPRDYTLADQKKAILNKQTLDVPVHGTWRLKDNASGNTLEEQRKSVARVPYMTRRGTFIFRGTEYTLANQQRLRPGVYSREKENGELEAHVNLLPGTGQGFRVFMEPETGVFKVSIGQANIPAFPLLKALGAQEADMKSSWGEDIYNVNAAKGRDFDLKKIYDRLVDAKTRREHTDPEVGIRTSFERKGLDPDVSQRTLGKPYANVSAEVLIRTMQKLKNIANKLEDVDDRDSQANQTIHGPEDLIAERVSKDAGSMVNNLLWKVTYKGNLKAIPSSALTKQLYSAILTSGLGAPLQEINPVEIFDQLIRVSRVGEGGISSDDAIPDSARNVSSTQLGLIDPIRGPECHDASSQVYTRQGWINWEDAKLDTEFACLINNVMKYTTCSLLFAEYYEGWMYTKDTPAIGYCVTPAHDLPYVSEGADGPATAMTDAHTVFTEKHDLAFIQATAVEGTISALETVLPKATQEGAATLLAWILAKGRLISHQLSDIQIEMGKVSLDSKDKEANTILQAAGINGSFTRNQVHIYNPELYKWLQQLGDNPHNWKLPEEVFNWTRAAREALLTGSVPCNRQVHDEFTTIQVFQNRTLSDQLERLALELGYLVQVRTYPGSNSGEQNVQLYKSPPRRFHHYEVEKTAYKGMVYCATVPGNMLLTRRGGSVGIWTGNSGRVGVDTRAAQGTLKGNDRLMYRHVTDSRTGKSVVKSAIDLINSTLAFPREMDDPNKLRVRAMVGNKIRVVNRDQVDYALPDGNSMFAITSSLVPGISGMAGGRLLMAGKMFNQALPLENAESPLVRSATPEDPDKSYEQLMGNHLGIVRADKGGSVLSVTPDVLTVKYDNGKKEEFELYNHHPLNQKTFWHNTVMFKPGDKFEPGALLARSNFTDKEGVTALGLNLRTVFLPFKGNYEDGMVISESAAKRLSSEHMYQISQDKGVEGLKIGKNNFLATYPGKFNRKQMDTIDETGVVRPGTIVHEGDPLVLGVKAKTPTKGLAILKQQRKWTNDASTVWDHHYPGVVTDTADSKGNVKVTVSSYQPMQTADKLSDRYGGKGVIGCYDQRTEILTDSGWKLFADLVPSDLVASLEQGRGTFVQPTKYICSEYTGELLGCNNSTLDYLVTPNHRLYTRTNHSKDFPMAIMAAEDVHHKPAIHMVAAKFDLPERELPNGLARFDSALIVELLVRYTLQDLGPRCLFRDETFPVSCEVYGEEMEVIDSDLYKLLDECGPQGARRLPPMLFQYKQLLEQLYTELVKVNYMTYVLSNVAVASRSKGLCDDLQRALALVGKPARIKPHQKVDGVYVLVTPNKTKGGTDTMSKIRHGHEYYSAPYAGNVYCVSVPSGIVLVRRGDKPMWCGNSIIPDEQMPRDKEGTPYEIVLNPLGIISRVNPSKLVEVALGRIARKTGKPYNMPAFSSDNMVEYALNELRKHDMDELQEIYDPGTTRAIKDVFAGEQFFMKLHHTSASKSGARDVGGYSMDQSPAKGGHGGCFPAPQKIQTIYGPVSIGAIVEKRLSIPVLTWLEDVHEWVYRPVTDWFTYRADKQDVLAIDVSGLCTSGGKAGFVRYTDYTLYPTKNHEVYTWNRGKVLAGTLTTDDVLVSTGPVITPDQEALIIGTMLGDAHMAATSGYLVIEHSRKQSDWLDWKAQCLQGLSPQSIDTEKSPTKLVKTHRTAKQMRVPLGYYGRKWRAMWYPDGKKIVTDEIVSKMTGLSVAAWVLDDGYIGWVPLKRKRKVGVFNWKGNISTQGFDEESTNRLVDFLRQRYGHTCSRQPGNGSINLSAGMCEALIQEIANYVPWHVIPTSKKHLKAAVHDIQAQAGFTKINLRTENQLGKVPMSIFNIRQHYGDKTGEINVYDITVKDTHKYMASMALVSNSKRIGLMDNNALISHGVPAVIKDAKLVRGQRNDEFWMNFRMGKPLTIPKHPFVYDKFFALMQSAGVNVNRSDTSIQLLAMGDDDVEQLSEGRELRSGDAIDMKSREPVKGGLFDLGVFGGMEGGRWGKLTLSTPMPHPLMEEPIMRLLKVTRPQFLDMLKAPGGVEKIQQQLTAINVGREIELAQDEIKTGRASKRDAAVKRLRYLATMKENGIKPASMMITKMPVLPPIFRPVTMTNGLELTSDANLLYKDLFEANQTHKEISKDLEDLGEEKMILYDAMRAVVGLGDPINLKHQEKNVAGVLAHLFGKNTPKFGMWQRKLMSTTVDMVGRSAITPDPKMDMDQVGMPEDLAWTVYRPHIMRRLARTYNIGATGVPLTELVKWIQDKDPRAKKAMMQELAERPVIITRAPVLHKYGIMGAWPILTKGNTLRLSPITTPGFNADFDGNCLSYHTEVKLEIDLNLVYTSVLGCDWASQLKDTLMRLTGNEMIELSTGKRASVRLPIGALPKVGVPVKDKNGADVYTLPDGVTITSYDHTTSTVVNSPVTKFTVDLNHECVKVTTKRKRTVEVSVNESLAVFDHVTGELVKQRPDQSIGAWMPVVIKEDITGTKYNREIGWWYGVLVSDGWVSKNTVGYAKNDEVRRDAFVDVARNHINPNFAANTYKQSVDDHENKFADSVKVHLNGAQLARSTMGITVHGTTGALNKLIPHELLVQGSRECLLGLLSGLLEGDACLAWNKVQKNIRPVAKTNTSSKYLVEDLKQLARLLGLRYSVTTTPARGISHESYVFSWGLVDLHKIGSELQFKSVQAQEWMKAFLGRPMTKDDINVVPVTRVLVDSVSPHLLRDGEHSLYSTWRKAAITGAIGRLSCLRTVNMLDSVIKSPEWDQFKTMALCEDIHWDCVDKIEPLPVQDVFDLEIPSTKVFMIHNGLIVYDTMNFHVPVTDEAAKEVREKMMPSKSLWAAGDLDVRMTPPQEYLLGLYMATRKPDKNKEPRVFNSRADAVNAYLTGKIRVTDPITIKG